MKPLAIATLIILAAQIPLAAQTKAPEKSAAKAEHKHEHAAHDHSSAQLNIAVDGKTVTVDFEAPADPIVGFEHEAQTPADKAKLAAALKKLKSEGLLLAIMPATAGCKQADVEMEFEKEGTHAVVHAEFDLKCSGDLTKGAITFGVSKLYPEISTVKVQLVSASGQQAGTTVTKDRGTVSLSPGSLGK